MKKLCPIRAPNKNRSGATNTEAAMALLGATNTAGAIYKTIPSITIGAVCPLIVADFPWKGKVKNGKVHKM